MANLQIELETIKFSESASDPRMNVLGQSDASDASKYPKYSVSGSSAGIVYDGDYDGVPYIFDPNDRFKSINNYIMCYRSWTTIMVRYSNNLFSWLIHLD